MELSLLLYAAVILLAFVYLTGYGSRPKNFPPGPIGLPIIGNVAQTGLWLHKKAVEAGKKYGDIVGYKIGSRLTVVLNNVEDIREAFSRPEFAGKSGFNPTSDETVEDYNKGLTMSHGRAWVEQRRFTLRTLRDFGFGKRSMEAIILEEMRELLIQFKKEHYDHPINTEHVFNVAVFNVIWSIVAGKRHEYGDPEFMRLLDMMKDFMESSFAGFGVLIIIFPSLLQLRKLKHRIFGRKPKKFLLNIYNYFRDTIKEHERTMEPGNPRDFIDTYLEEIKKTSDPSSSFYSKDSEDDSNIVVTLLDLFMAGSETTSSTLQWIFFSLSKHPEIQEKLFQEIHSVVGQREVVLSDRPNLPYTEAVISEVMRVATLAPLGAPHAVDRDMNFKGYFIPKGTLVFANLYAALQHSPEWEEPEKFKPERFLSADGKSVVRPKSWMPFGTGRRACLGEALARDELFLFATNLVQNLRVTFPDDEPAHSWEGHFRVGFVPESHRVLVTSRI